MGDFGWVVKLLKMEGEIVVTEKDLFSFFGSGFLQNAGYRNQISGPFPGSIGMRPFHMGHGQINESCAPAPLL